MDETSNDVDVLGALRRAPLFAGLSAAELQRVAARCTVRNYGRDDIVFSMGDHAEELLVVVWGELTVSNDAGSVARLRAGDVVGELALLLDEPRSAKVTCSRASAVLVLDRELFRELVRDEPRVLTYLTQLLSRRAFDFVRARPTGPATSLVAVVADAGVPGASLVAASVTAIAASLAPRDALLLRVGRGRRTVASIAKSPGKVLTAIGADRGAVVEMAMPETGPGGIGEAVAALLRVAEGRFRCVVIDVAGAATDAEVEGLRQWCDSVVRVTTSATGPAAPGVVRVLNRRHPATPALPVNSNEPFLLPDSPNIAGRSARDAAAHLVSVAPRPSSPHAVSPDPIAARRERRHRARRGRRVRPGPHRRRARPRRGWRTARPRCGHFHGFDRRDRFGRRAHGRRHARDGASTRQQAHRLVGAATVTDWYRHSQFEATVEPASCH